ncbi:sensor histidine kinase [Enterococcus sp. DIV0086]|uniref:sensor histidine kinase n=1 Tax=Enterococcus sp. DIV0086 TaxID=2774655 RepID=UPI003D2AD167
MDVNEDIELPSGIKPLEKQFNIVRKNLENQKIMLKNSEDNKREIITHLAHDLKTPLTSIIGYLTIIKTKSNLEHDIQKKYIDISLDKSNKLNSMINELFEMSSFHDYTKTLNIQK